MLDIELDEAVLAGRRLAYRRAGRGPLLVLLHGGMSDGREWLPVMSELAEVATVVAPDLPGCGGSADPGEGWSLGDYADSVVGLVDRLGGPVHLGGLSVGGGLALQAAAQAPDRVRSLVLLSAYAGWAGSLPAAEVRARLAWVRALAAEPPEATGADVVPDLLGRPLPPDRAALLADAARGTRWGPSRVLAEAFAAADLRPALSSIGVPALVVHGDLDRRAPREVAEALCAGLPLSRLAVVSGAGHQLNLEAPDEVAALVREHLASWD